MSTVTLQKHDLDAVYEELARARSAIGDTSNYFKLLTFMMESYQQQSLKAKNAGDMNMYNYYLGRFEGVADSYKHFEALRNDPITSG